MLISNTLVQRIAEAIAKAEGFGVPGSVPTRAHNPGDMTDDGDIGHGVIESSGLLGAKITIYPSDAYGWARLYWKVRHMLSGRSHVYLPSMSIAEIAKKYSGSEDWARNVAEQLGVTTATTLNQLIAADNPTQELQWPNA